MLIDIDIDIDIDNQPATVLKSWKEALMAKVEMGVEIKAFADTVQTFIKQASVNRLRTHSPV